MKRNLSLLLTLAATLASQTAFGQIETTTTVVLPGAPAKKANALDKKTLEDYLRHLFLWPTEQVNMTIDDPKDGLMPGYAEIHVRGVMGNQFQDESFYVSKDGQKIIRGTVFDVNQNPFKDTIEKLKTSMQPSYGTPGASAVIVEFSDFQCPYCREESKTLRQNLLAAFPTQVRVYHMDFPLDQIHPWARTAAIAGRCVFNQSATGFWDYHDWMFDHQAEINPDNVKAKIKEFAGVRKDIDGAVLNQCIETKATEPEVNKTQQLAVSVGVNQTPWLFLNGRPLPGTRQWPELKFIIEQELGYQKTAKNAGEDCGCDVSLPTPGVAKPGESSITPAKPKQQ